MQSLIQWTTRSYCVCCLITSLSAALLSTGFSPILASGLSRWSNSVIGLCWSRRRLLSRYMHMGQFLDLLDSLHTPRIWQQKAQHPLTYVYWRHTTLQQHTCWCRVCSRPSDRLVSDVAKWWCASCRLQLNANKTETIWFGSRSNLAKLQRFNQSLQVGPSNIQPSSVVRDLGVYLDSGEITMKQTSPKLPPPASTTFVICVRSVVGSATKLHSSWSWHS